MMVEKKEELYSEAPIIKAQNIRFILTTALVAVVILGIAVWGIVYAVSGEKKVETDNNGVTEVVAEENIDSNEEKSDNVIEVTNLSEEKAAATETTATTATAATAETKTTTTTKSDIPKTGPEGILPIALLAGTFVAFIGSLKLAKIKA